MFIYNKNGTQIKDSGGNDTVPLIWMWENLTSTTYGWTAANYFATFVLHMITSLMEFISFFLFIQGKNRWFGFWVSTVGWWGSVLGLMLPWLFALF